MNPKFISTWTGEEAKRFTSQWVTPRDAEIKKAIQDCDLVHLHNPMIEGAWYAKKFSKPCVMTIYNWRRRGIHPRLLAWNWAVRQADRRWYISEFVWDSLGKKRKKNSARLPVVSQNAPRETCRTKEKVFIYWKMGAQQRNSYFIGSLSDKSRPTRILGPWSCWETGH